MKASWESSQKQQDNNYTLKPINKGDNDNESEDNDVYSYGNTPDSPSGSSPLSMSDLYDNAQPIVIPARKDKSDTTDNHQKPSSLPRASSVSSVVANALAVPGALKEIFYPSSSTNVNNSRQISKGSNDVEQNQLNLKSADIISEPSSLSSSSDEEEKPMVDWLNEKRYTGMKLVNGLIGRSSGSGSTAALYQNSNNDNDVEEICMLENDEADKKLFFHYGEIIDDRTLINFRKYFVLPESEKLLAGN